MRLRTVVLFYLSALGFFAVLLYAAVSLFYLTKTSYLAVQTAKASILDEQITSLKAAIRQRKPITIPILMYHYVEVVTDENDTFRKAHSIAPVVFESQITTLLDAGYHPIHFADLMQYFNGVKDLPNKPVILTFDDGYRDLYTDAFPILQKREVKAVAYIVSGFIDLNKNYLTLPQLQELSRSPFIEIGAHSAHHLDLTLLTPQQSQQEIFRSKQALEALIGKPVVHFAYPYGTVNPLVEKQVKQGGFQTAVTVSEGTTHLYANRLRLKRVRPENLTGDAFLNQLR